jgi:hypothetical protein
MKKSNQIHIDSLIKKIIIENLEEKADSLVSKIKKGRTPTDDEVEEMMSSEVTENMETCEHGVEIREGETCEQCRQNEIDESDMGDLENAPTEFDYVEEDEDVELEDSMSIDGEDPLGLIDRYCNKGTPDYDKQRCDYHSKNFGGEMNEKLHGGQKKLDKNRNGRIDSEDFKMLRKKKQGYDDREDEREGMKHGKMKGKDLKSMKSRRDDARFERRGETEEGNAFTGALAKAKDKGNDEFEVDGKEYQVTNESKNRIRLRESEMIDLIEKIIMQEQKSNIKPGSPRGLETYKKVHKKDGKENNDALKATAKKMKEYLKDGSKGDYETDPDFFPKGNGELAKMSKKAYVPSGAVQDYIDNFTAASLENLDYDGISPNEDWVTDNIEGSSRTGNNPEWANTGKSDVNKKRNKIRKDNMLAKLKRKAYNKSPQPIVNDRTGEDEGDKIMTKLESIEPKGKKVLNEEFDRMKSLMGYNRKTQ